MTRKLTQDPNFTQAPNSSGADDNYLLWMPSRLAGDLSIDQGAKMLFLFVSNFLRRDGYAICSDAWLVGKLGVEARMVQYYLNQLEEKGYIWRETWRKGMKLERRIWQSKDYLAYLEETGGNDEDFKKCFRNAMYCDSEPQCIATANSNVLRYNPKEENIKERRERESTAQAPPSPSPPVKSSPKKKEAKKRSYTKLSVDALTKEALVERVPHHPQRQSFVEEFKGPLVAISDSRHDELLAKHGSFNLEQIYGILADWTVSKASSNPKEVIAHGDYGRIKDWVAKKYYDSLQSKKGKAPVVPSGTPLSDRAERNRKICKAVEDTMPQSHAGVFFQAQPNCAILVNMPKDFSKTYVYESYDPVELKATLLKDLPVCFPNAAEMLLPKPKAPATSQASSLISQLASTYRVDRSGACALQS